jgi:hypothetical protein
VRQARQGARGDDARARLARWDGQMNHIPGPH